MMYDDVKVELEVIRDREIFLGPCSINVPSWASTASHLSKFDDGMLSEALPGFGAFPILAGRVNYSLLAAARLPLILYPPGLIDKYDVVERFSEHTVLPSVSRPHFFLQEAYVSI